MTERVRASVLLVAGLFTVFIALPVGTVLLLTMRAQKPGPHPFAQASATDLPRSTIEALAPTINRLIFGKNSTAELLGTRLEVTFTIADNLTMDMIRSGARRDVTKIAKAAIDSGVSFDSLSVVGSATMKDQYGNLRTSRVVTVILSRGTLQKVNWNGFDHNKIYAIADSANVDSAFK